MKKIVIAGASVYGLSNVSDDSMFSVFCRELHKNIPDLEITLLARHPSKKLDDMYKVHSIKNLDHESKQESLGRWFMGLNKGDSTEHLAEIWNAIKTCNLLILGGDPFIDITIGLYRGISPYTALLITLAKFLGKPVMLHGIHIGRPLNTEIGREISKFCISNSQLITIREEESRELIMDLGVENTENIVSLADTSYGLDPVKGKEAGMSILKKERIEFSSERVIGVTFRHMYWKWKKKDWEHYSGIMAELCDFMIEKFNADLLFIPHCFYNIDHPYEDDRPAAKEIIARMKNKQNAHRITGEYNLFEILSLFPLLSMIFSNRRHSAIFAALHNVVGMGVGEEWHVKPPMQQLGVGEKYFVSVDDFKLEKLKQNVIEVWNNRDTIKENIRRNLPSLKEKAIRNAELAVELLNDYWERGEE